MSNSEPIDWGVNFGAEDTRAPASRGDGNVLEGLRRLIAEPTLSAREESSAGKETLPGVKGRSSVRKTGSRKTGARKTTSRNDPESDESTSQGEAKPMSPERAERFARNIVLQQLTASMKSRQQLAKKLAEKNVPEDIANKVLDRMEEVHLVDDETFAQMWVESRHVSRKLGKRSLQRELRDKGIAEELAQQALETVSEEDEREACRALVQKKLGVSSPSEVHTVEVDDSAPWETRQAQLKERDKQKRRLLSMLMRKGYSGSLAMAVVSEYV